MAALARQLGTYLNEVADAVSSAAGLYDDVLLSVEGISRLMDSVVALKAGYEDVNPLLFASESPPDLLQFVKRTVAPGLVKDATLAKARAKVYTMIGAYIGSANEHVVGHGGAILDTCLRALSLEQASVAGLAVMSPLVALVKSPLYDGDTLQVNKLLGVLMNMVRIVGQRTQSVRGAVFEFAGLLLSRYPNATATKKGQELKDLFGACHANLQAEFRADKPKLKLIRGCIACMDFLLQGHPDLVEDTSSRLTGELYTYIFNSGISLPPGLSRFDVPVAALRFVMHHAVLFRAQIYEDHVGLFERLLVCRDCSHLRVARATPDSAAAVYVQVAVTITSPDAPGDAKATFAYFIRQFTAMIEGKRSADDASDATNPLDTMRMGVKGCGVFSGALKRFLGEDDLKRVFLKLLHSNELLLSADSIAQDDADIGDPTDPDDEGYTPLAARDVFSSDTLRVTYRAETLLTYAAMVSHLRPADIDELVLSRLSGLVELLVYAFPTLPGSFRAARATICRAVLCLLFALRDKAASLNIVLSRLMFDALIHTLGSHEETAHGKVHPITALPEPRLLFEYVPMWRELVNPRDPFTLAVLRSAVLHNDLSAALGQPMFDDIVTPAQPSGGDAADGDEDGGEGAAAGAGGVDDMEDLLAGDGPSFDDVKQAVVSKIYDQLMTAILRVIGELDLSVAAEGIDGDDSDGDDSRPPVVQGFTGMAAELLHAVVPRDFTLFLNLVEFCQFFLPLAPHSAFDRWVYVFSQRVITGCNRYPLVSGFFKLLTVAMYISDSTSFFRGSPTLQDADESMADEDTSAANSRYCRTLVSKFAKEVVDRLPQYKDELLVACVTFLLGLPAELSSPALMQPAAQAALTTGMSHLPAAVAGLDALERWHASNPALLDPMLPAVLPLLGNLLMKTRLSEALTGEVEQRGDDEDDQIKPTLAPAHSPYAFAALAAIGKKKMTNSAKKRYKATARYSSAVCATVDRRSGANCTSDTAESSQALRVRVLMFLGSLGGDARHVLGSMEDHLLKSVSWDNEQRLRLGFPLANEKVDIFLDGMLPVVAELAEQSGDRQTKVVACELLQAVMLFLVGSTFASVARRGGDATSVYAKLYERLFPLMLRLATDVEQVARQLFEPLTLQLVRLFSQRLSDETVALLDAVADGMSSPDAALRTFSARCMAEFLNWSIKQAGPKEPDSPTNLDALLRRLFALAQHPSPYRRAGAATAFNFMYRHLRENEDLVDRYALELVHTMLDMLRVSAQDPPAFGTSELAAAAVDHLLRIVVRKAELLSCTNVERSTFAPSTVMALADWLFEHVGAKETQFRRKCQQLFDRIAVTVAGDPSAPRHVQARSIAADILSREGLAKVVSYCEAHGGVGSLPPALAVRGHDGVAETMEWMVNLSTALDAYTWMFRRGYLSPLEALSGVAAPPAPKSKKRGRGRAVAATAAPPASSVLLRLKHFLATFAFDAALVAPTVADAGAASWHLADAPLTPSELDAFYRLRAILVCRICMFVATVLSPASDMEDTRTEAAALLHGAGVTQANLHRLVFLAVLDPAAVAMDTIDSMAGSQILIAARRFFRCVDRVGTAVDASFRDDCVSVGEELLASDAYDIARVDLTQESGDAAALSALVRALSILHDANLLGACLGDGAAGLPARFGRAVVDLPPTASPLQVQLCSGALDLAFDMGWDALHAGAGSALECVLSDAPVEDGGTVVGVQFYSRFKDVLDLFFLRKDVWPDVCPALSLAIRRHRGAGQNQAWFVLSSIMDRMVGTQAPPTAAGAAFATAVAPTRHPRVSLFTFVDSVATQLPVFQFWVDATTENGIHNFLSLVARLAQLFPRVLVASPGCPHALKPESARVLWDGLRTALAPTSETDVKVESMALLPFLLPGFHANAPVPHFIGPTPFALSDLPAQVLELVSTLLVRSMPVNSRDPRPGTQDFSDHRRLLEALLAAVSDSGSLQLLKCMFLILREGSSHVFFSDIAAALATLAANTVVEGAAADELVVQCIMLVLDADADRVARRIVLEHLLLPALQRLSAPCLAAVASSPAFAARCSPHVTGSSLLKHVVSMIPQMRASAIPGTAERRFQLSWALSFIACFYEALPIDTIKTTLTQAWMETPSVKGNELTSHVCKYAKLVCFGPVEESAVEERLELCRAAWLCICSVVSKTQSKLKFFESLLFKENAMSGEYLWENLVDRHAVYSFEVETNFDSIQVQVNRLSAAVPRKSRAQKVGFLSQLGMTQSHSTMSLLTRAAAKGVAGSSLSTSRVSVSLSSQALHEGVAFVSSQSLMAEGDEAYATDGDLAMDGGAAAGGGGVLGDMAEPAEAESAVADTTTMEIDDIADNPIMLALLRLVDHMTAQFHADVDMSDVDKYVHKAPGAMPTWMQSLCHRLGSTETSLNVKLFVMKLLYLRVKLFRPWAQLWFGPLLQALNQLSTMPAMSTSFHYFLREMCTVFWVWEHAKPTVSFEFLAANTFLDHLVSVSTFMRESVWRANLQILSRLIHNWKDARHELHLDVTQLGTMMAGADARSTSHFTEADRRCATATQVLYILLSEGLPAWDSNKDRSKVPADKFYAKIAKGIMLKPKMLYLRFAELCGLMMERAAAQRAAVGEDPEDALTFLPAALAKVLSDAFHKKGKAKTDRGPGRFINSLCVIGSRYAHIVDRALLRRAVGFLGTGEVNRKGLKYWVVNVIHARFRTGDEPDLFAELIPYLHTLLLAKEAAAQAATLKLLRDMLPTLTGAQIMMFLDSSKAHSLGNLFPGHPNVDCRQRFYDILCWLWDNHPDFAADGAGAGVGDSAPSRVLLRKFLLGGLSDSASAVRNKVYSFWNSETRLSDNPITRLQRLANDLYDPDHEQHWLQYAVHLLTTLSHKSADFLRPMFSDPLDGSSNFETHHINPFWGSAMSMQPLFGGEDGGSPAGMVLATQTSGMEFSLTQAPAGGERASVPGPLENVYVIPGMQATQTQATLGAGAGRSAGGSAAMELLRTVGVVGSRMSFGSTLSLREKAFLPSFPKRASNASGFYADQETAKKERQRAEALQQANARRNNVTLYRAYRKGELPDIQIKLKDLLDPLQALCERSRSLARALLGEMTKRLYVHEPVDPGGAPLPLVRQPDSRRALFGHLTTMLSNTKHDAGFVAAVHAMCRELSTHHAALSAVGVDDLPAFPTPPKTIGSTAAQSLNFVSGIRALEEGLLAAGVAVDVYGMQAAPSSGAGAGAPARRGRGRGATAAPVLGRPKAAATAAEISDAWAQLGKLYDLLGDEEVLRGLISRNSSIPETTLAIDAELRGAYDEANVFYQQCLKLHEDAEFLDVKPTKDEVSAWESRQLVCCQMLGKWGSVATSIAGNDPPEGLVKARGKLLPLLIHSRTYDDGSGDFSALSGLVDECMATSDATDWLVSHNGHDAALSFVVRSDTDRAAAMVAATFDDLISKWSSLSPLSPESRAHVLAPLQRLVEMKEFIDLEKHLQRAQSRGADMDGVIRAIKTTLGRWEQRWPSRQSDGLLLWSAAIRTREVLMNRLLDFVGGRGVAGTEDVMAHIRIVKRLTYAAGCESFTQHGVVSTASDYLKLCMGASREANISHSASDLRLWTELYHNRAQMKPDDACRLESRNLSKVQGSIVTHGVDGVHRAGAAELQCTAARRLAELCLNTGDVPDEKFLPGLSAEGAVSLAYDLLSASAGGEGGASGASRSARGAGAGGRVSSKRTKVGAVDGGDAGEDLSTEAAEAHCQLASFCDGLLRHWDQAQLAHLADDVKELAVGTVSDFAGSRSLTRAHLAGTIVTSVLAAVRGGSKTARQLLPRVFQLVSDHSAVRPQFRNMAALVPAWMFLSWISQLMGMLSCSGGDLFADVLVRVAKEYPQAVFYPFTVTAGSIGDTHPDLIARVGAQLRLPTLTTFVEALDYLNNPDLRVKDAIAAAQLDVRAGKDPKEAYKQLLGVFEHDRSLVGHLHTQAAKAKSKVVGVFGSGSKLSDSSFQNAKRVAREVMRDAGTGKMDLKSFSKWLAEYAMVDAGPSELAMELPGQYTGDERPDPAAHIRIASFGKKILTMSSLRRPKRLTVHGHDQRDYYFLVKAGEDLRLDQRIEQLFVLMNDVFKQSPKTARRGLDLKTYAVIPMTTNVGMIEWVTNTTTVKSLLNSKWARTDVGERRSTLEGCTAAVKYRELHKLSASKNYLVSTLNVYQHAKASEAVPAFQQICNEIPHDLLRNHLVDMSCDAEAFLAMRSQFIRSLAALSIGGYVTGIGDRHLDNFLVSNTTGCLIGIDFGSGFGVGQHTMPIPEMLPFRLCPQFANVLRPVDTTDALKHHMSHTMHALSDSADRLLTTMNVFVTEPLLDWRKPAGAFKASEESLEGSAAFAGSQIHDADKWFPLRRIHVARRKLSRANPSVLMMEEIAENPSVSRRKGMVEAINEVCMGPRGAKRRCPENASVCPTVEAQVECLIELAVDQNMLVRQWHGLATWL